MSEPRYSEVSICNQALGWLGQSPIVSLEQNSNVARLCRENYPVLRDAVIESRCWTFATIRRMSETTLQTGDESEDPDFPQWGDQFVHPIPGDFMKVFRCYRDASTSKLVPARWEAEGGYILADENRIMMWGVRSVKNPNDFGVLFTQCLASRIAADLAIPVTKSRELQAQMWQLYEQKLADAAVRDGQQGRSEMQQPTRLQNSRMR